MLRFAGISGNEYADILGNKTAAAKDPGHSLSISKSSALGLKKRTGGNEGVSQVSRNQ